MMARRHRGRRPGRTLPLLGFMVLVGLGPSLERGASADETPKAVITVCHPSSPRSGVPAVDRWPTLDDTPAASSTLVAVLDSSSGRRSIEAPSSQTTVPQSFIDALGERTRRIDKALRSRQRKPVDHKHLWDLGQSAIAQAIAGHPAHADLNKQNRKIHQKNKQLSGAVWSHIKEEIADSNARLTNITEGSETQQEYSARKKELVRQARHTLNSKPKTYRLEVTSTDPDCQGRHERFGDEIENSITAAYTSTAQGNPSCYSFSPSKLEEKDGAQGRTVSGTLTFSVKTTAECGTLQPAARDGAARSFTKFLYKYIKKRLAIQESKPYRWLKDSTRTMTFPDGSPGVAYSYALSATLAACNHSVRKAMCTERATGRGVEVTCEKFTAEELRALPLERDFRQHGAKFTRTKSGCSVDIAKRKQTTSDRIDIDGERLVCVNGTKTCAAERRRLEQILRKEEAEARGQKKRTLDCFSVQQCKDTKKNQLCWSVKQARHATCSAIRQRLVSETGRTFWDPVLSQALRKDAHRWSLVTLPREKEELQIRAVRGAQKQDGTFEWAIHSAVCPGAGVFKKQTLEAPTIEHTPGWVRMVWRRRLGKPPSQAPLGGVICGPGSSPTATEAEHSICSELLEHLTLPSVDGFLHGEEGGVPFLIRAEYRKRERSLLFEASWRVALPEPGWRCFTF